MGVQSGSSIAAVAAPRHLPGRIRLWQVDLDRYVASTSLDGLSAEEETRARGLTAAAEAGRFRAAHHALRSLLGAVLGRDGRDLAFDVGPFGQPSVSGEPALHFSLSHSESVALIGLGERPVGVDVEMIRPVPERDGLAETHLTAEELARWRSADPVDRDRALLECWTRKEAVAKALGVGLSLPPQSIETIGPAGPRARLGDTWWPVAIEELQLGRGAVAAVALVDRRAVDEAQRALMGQTATTTVRLADE